MTEPGHDIMIKDALVFFVAAGLIVPALRVVKLPTVIAFILAGVALGPSGLGRFYDMWPVLEFVTISDPAAAAPFAELGILFLLFLLGLELSFGKLWSLKHLVFGAGAAQAGLSALAIGFALLAAGLPGTTAALLGLAFALSSTAIVMQTLIENHRTSTSVGRTSLGVLLFQDILVAPILIFAGFMAQDGDSGLFSVIFEALWKGITALIVILVIGRYLLAPLYRLAANTGGRDFLMAITLLTIVGASVITASAGLSLALGAFLAGMMLGETEFKHQTEVDLEPFKGLLLGLFFMTVGTSVDLQFILEHVPVILFGVVCLLLIKASIAAMSVRIFTGENATAAETAGLLAPAGEFAFVILATGTATGVISAEIASIATAIGVLTMLSIPLTWKLGASLGDRMKKAESFDAPAPSDYADLEGHVVIAGFGRVGQAVAHIFSDEETAFVALERDPRRVAAMRKQGWRVYLGDGGREEILIKAGARGAAMLVVTLDDPQAAVATVLAARCLRPMAPILSRAKDAEHARTLYAAGANFVVPDAIEAGLQMAARALEEFGYDGDLVRDRLAAHRDQEYRAAMKSIRAEEADSNDKLEESAS